MLSQLLLAAFFILSADAQSCNPGVLTSPTPNQVIASGPVWFNGTVSPAGNAACLVNSLKIGSTTINLKAYTSTTFGVFAYRYEAPTAGTYTVVPTYAGIAGPSFSFTLNNPTPSCSIPIITSPAAGTAVSGNITIAGYYPANSIVCSGIVISPTTGGAATLGTVRSDGTFSITLTQALNDGVQMNFAVSPATSSSGVLRAVRTLDFTVTNTFRCPPPTSIIDGTTFGSESTFLQIPFDYGAYGSCDNVAWTILDANDGQYSTGTKAKIYGPFTINTDPAKPMIAGMTYTVRITVSSAAGTRTSEPTAIKFTFASTRCPYEYISPAAGATVNDPNPVVQLRVTDRSCTVTAGQFSLTNGGGQVSFEYVRDPATGRSVIPYDPATQIYSLRPSYTLGTGSWRVSGDVAGPANSRINSFPARSFMVDATASSCSGASVRIIEPANDQIIRNKENLNVRVEYTTSPGCTSMLFSQTNAGGVAPVTRELAYSSLTYGSPTVYRIGTIFSLKNAAYVNGQYSASMSMSHYGGADPSPASGITVTLDPGLCPPPVITWQGGTGPYSRDIVISGTTDGRYGGTCQDVSVYFNGESLPRVLVRGAAPATNNRKRQTMYTWSTPPITGIAPYTYSVTAVTGDTTTRSPASNSVVYTATDVSDPVPSPAAQRRRALRCKADEELCYFTSAAGKPVQECIPDGASNIERCGGCYGQDCTGLPFVNGPAR